MKPPSLVETRTSEGLLWRFDVPRESSFFDGHFPGHPLLPGVVTLAWMLAAAERFLDRPLAGGATLHNVKFQVVLLPGQTEIELSVTSQGKGTEPGRHLVARVVSPAGVHASALIEPASDNSAAQNG